MRPKFTSSPASRAHAMIFGRFRLWNDQPLKLTGLPWLLLRRHWDENHFKNCSEDHGQTATLLQDQWQGIFQKQATQQVWPQVGTRLQDCPNWAWQTLPTHRKPRNWKSMILQCEGCSSGTSYRILEYRYTTWHSWKICQPSCKLPTISLHD